jgi:predicted dinucleotide-binding enzyme
MKYAILGSGAIGTALARRAVPDAVKGINWGGRIVVDATNAIDFPAFSPRDLKGRLSTQIVGEAVLGARVVKAFNTLPAPVLAEEPAQQGGRRVLFISSDDNTARAAVVDLVGRLGFAAVDMGRIAEGGHAQQFGGGVAAKNFIQIG